jgi:hypothetical protein
MRPDGRHRDDSGSIAPAEVGFYSIVKERWHGERLVGDGPRARARASSANLTAQAMGPRH